MSGIRVPNLWLIVLLTCLAAAPCGAATWTIHADGSGDFATLADAALNASSGDVIELSSGTYSGAGNTDVSIANKTLTVRSQTGNPADVTFDCQGNSGNPHRALMVTGSGSSGTLIEGITIINGYGYPAGIHAAGAILIASSSNTTVRNCNFENNHVGMSWDHAGGAVYVDYHCHATFEGCNFLGNSAYFGGAVGVNHYSTAEFSNCRFFG